MSFATPKQVLEFHLLLLILLGSLCSASCNCKVNNVKTKVLLNNEVLVFWTNEKPRKCWHNYCYHVTVTTKNDKASRYENVEKYKPIEEKTVNTKQTATTFKDLYLYPCVLYDFCVDVIHCEYNFFRQTYSPKICHSEVFYIKNFPDVTHGVTDYGSVIFNFNNFPNTYFCSEQHTLRIFKPSEDNKECRRTDCMSKVYEESFNTASFTESNLKVDSLEYCINYVAEITLVGGKADNSRQMIPFNLGSASVSDWKIDSFLVKDAGEKWIVLSWSTLKAFSNCKKFSPSYELEVYNESSKMLEKYDIEQQVVEFNVTERLKACSTYKFVLNMVGSKQTESSTVTGTTLPDDPEEVKEFKVVNVTYNSVSLSWTIPNSGIECAKQYILLFTDSDQKGFHITKVHLPIDVTTYTNRNLQPCTFYNISITTNGLAEDSQKVQVTAETVVQAVENFKANSIERTSVILSWTKPRFRKECAKGYTIEVKDPEGYVRTDYVSINATTYLIKGLRPCMSYVFSIVTNGATGDSPKVEINSAAGGVEAPEEVINLKILDTTQNSIKLSWEKPSIGMACAVEYLLTVRDSNGLVKSTGVSLDITIYTFRNLNPCTQYTVSIRVIGFTKDSPEVEINGETRPTDLDQNLKAVNVSKRSVSLIWSSPAFAEKCIELYQLTWFTDHAKPLSISVNGHLNKYDISHLEPCSKYTFRVSALSKKIKLSDPIQTTAVTKKDVPRKLEVIRVIDVTTTTMKLRWTKPSYAAACVSQYFFEFNSSNGSTNLIKVPSNFETYTKTDLLPCSLYTIRYAIIGKGAKKEPIQWSEMEAATLSKVPEKVQSLNVVGLSSKGVSLAWKPLASSMACIEEYKLSWFDETDLLLNEVRLSANVTRYLVEPLEPCCKYNFSIIAIGGKDQSDPVYTTAVMGAAGTEGILEQFSVKHIGKDWIELMWSQKNISQCMHHYVLEVHMGDKVLKKIDIERNRTEFNVTDILKPCSTYEFVLNMIGVKQIGINNTLVAKTLSVVPDEVLKLNITDISKREVSLVWTPPTMYACVEKYELSWFDSKGDLVNRTNLGSDVNEYNVINLEPCSVYKFSIVAEGNQGVSGSITTDAFIEPEALLKPVYGNYSELSSTNVLLNWQLKDKIQCSLSALIISCKEIKSDNYLGAQSGIQGSPTTEPESTNSLTFNVTNAIRDKDGYVYASIDGLEALTNYSCSARAENAAGLSEQSDDLIFGTLQGRTKI